MPKLKRAALWFWGVLLEAGCAIYGLFCDVEWAKNILLFVMRFGLAVLILAAIGIAHKDKASI